MKSDVIAIAAPFPHSLGRVNVDGELVEDLFTRARVRRSRMTARKTAGDTHIRLADAHFNAMKAHQLASDAQQRAGEKTKCTYHYQKASQHQKEAQYHSEQYDLNLLAAEKGYAGTRTPTQRRLIKDGNDPKGPTLRCARDATKSKNNADAVIAYIDSGGQIPLPDPLKEPPIRHKLFPIQLQF